MKSVAFFIAGICLAEAKPIFSSMSLSLLGRESKHGYTTTFFDDFTGSKNTLPSEKNWIFDLGTQYEGGPPKWGNNEYETYTKSTENVALSGTGLLNIIPLKDASGNWTSARIETQRDDFAATSGGKLYVESRIKLGNADPVNLQGIWPAFWALGKDLRDDYMSWPAPSEWDFLEVVNDSPDIYSTLHCGFAPDGPCNEYNGLGNGGILSTSGSTRGAWHTFGFLVDRSMTGYGKDGTWADETLTWFLDGAVAYSLQGSTVGNETAWEKVAHEGHFLLLNVAVGGNWPGAPNNNTKGGPGSGMAVDYVGVWNSN